MSHGPSMHVIFLNGNENTLVTVRIFLSTVGHLKIMQPQCINESMTSFLLIPGIMKKSSVWPTLFLLNISTALKELIIIFLFALWLVFTDCGSYIMLFFFFFFLFCFVLLLFFFFKILCSKINQPL